MEAIIECACTVFKKVDKGFLAGKSRNGDLLIGHIYSENFVCNYLRHNAVVII